MKLVGIAETLDFNPYLTCRVLNHVPRWSTVPVVRRQTVGEHCFLVARYCTILAGNLGLFDRVNIGAALTIALTHDDDELVTGDRPSPDKEDTSFEMPTIEYGLVKVADRLEAYMYVLEEIELGNKYMTKFSVPIYGRYQETRSHFIEKFQINTDWVTDGE